MSIDWRTCQGIGTCVNSGSYDECLRSETGSVCDMFAETKTFKNDISDSIARSLEVNMSILEDIKAKNQAGLDAIIAPKNDEDKYSKVQYSLVPWDILSRNYLMDREPMTYLQFEIHQFINGKSCFTEKGLFDSALKIIDVKYLAIALGYGCVKYIRDSWLLGFGGNSVRMLEACLRHGHKYLCGVEYDGEIVDGYPLGLPHLSGVLSNLLFAYSEVK